MNTKNQVCYNARGKTTWDQKAHIPCNLTAVAAGLHSSCCAEGSVCLTNGLCIEEKRLGKTNWYYRDGCTDKTWSDPACGKYCTSIENDRETGLIMQCPSPESWCCAVVGTPSIGNWPAQDAYNTTCCSRDDLTFRADGPVVFNNVENEPGQPYSTTTIVYTVTEFSFMSAPTASAPTASGDVQTSPQPAGLGTGSKIGIGVGVSVGVLGLAAIGMLVWLRRKRNSKNVNKPSGTAGTDMSGEGFMLPYQETETKQQYAMINGDGVPSPYVAHELPGTTVAPTELPIPSPSELPVKHDPMSLSNGRK
ncbi:hypothetical protein OPT61_g274 [Boeremia exigua]|uniref:Uncharacterized protein n=1 Tax=Boeremia exigua TaxID=749465 RepID=A0ACC2IUQ0_9PLEO|nr:hypothetical protein OPT61_g274 [Boeremia exigua]